MTVGPSLSAEGEAVWLRVKHHLEWCDDFALVFVFSDQPAVVAVLRQRLAAIYRARITGLEVPVPRTPNELLDGLLPRLLHPPLYQQVLQAPVWLDLTRLPPGTTEGDAATWQEARLGFLARLNEQREPLRRTLTKPLILVLPLAEKARVKALAPDLWAIRHFSIDTGPWLAPAAAEAPALPPSRPEPFPLTLTEASLVREWWRLRDKDSKERGALLAGARAFDALISRGQLAEAGETAAWMVETAHARLVERPDDPEALRDLSISLNNVGGTDQALGDLERARAAFAESLEIARRLTHAFPNLTDYKGLRDWFERRLRGLEEAQEGDRFPFE